MIFLTESDYSKIQQWLLKHSKKDSDFRKADLPLKGSENVAIILHGNNVLANIKDLSEGLVNVTKFVILSSEEYKMITPKLDTFYFCIHNNQILNTFIGSYSVSKFLLDLIDDLKHDLVSLIGDDLAVYLEDLLTAEHIKVNSSMNLQQILGIQTKTDVTLSQTHPKLLIYDPVSNIYTNESLSEVEFGTKIINKATTLKARFIQGSSGGLEQKLVFAVIDGNIKNKIPINITTLNYNPLGYTYESVATDVSYYVGKDNSLTISLETGNDTLEELLIHTLPGINTVVKQEIAYTSATHLNYLGEPVVIEKGPIQIANINYNSVNLSCKITYRPFKYMYVHRSKTSFSDSSFGNTVGKTDYIARKKFIEGNWTLNNVISDPQYYALLIPIENSLIDFYTTFLNTNSNVEFDLIGSTFLYGATDLISTEYAIYVSKLQVAFADGTMTFTIN